MNCISVNTFSCHFNSYPNSNYYIRRQLLNFEFCTPQLQRGWSSRMYNTLNNTDHRRVWGFPGPRRGAAGQHPISDWTVGKGGSPLQTQVQTQINSHIKFQTLDALLSPYITFVDKHKNLSDEERCKIPAVQMKQDLQWCGGQLRYFVKKQHEWRQTCNSENYNGQLERIRQVVFLQK